MTLPFHFSMRAHVRNDRNLSRNTHIVPFQFLHLRSDQAYSRSTGPAGAIGRGILGATTLPNVHLQPCERLVWELELSSYGPDSCFYGRGR